MSNRSHTSYILGIETSGKVGGVALERDGEIIGEISFEKGLIHGRALVPMIKQLLEERSLKPEDVGAVAVSAGPGSFTGVRVGVACAKTFAYATGAKLVSVGTPDVVVQNAPHDYEHAIPVSDARRGNVVGCIYRLVGGEWAAQTDFLAVAPEELLAHAPRGSLMLGDAIPRFGEIFRKAGMIIADESLWYGRASWVVRLARRKIEQGIFEDPVTFAPQYLRPTEAEVNLMQKRMREKYEKPSSGGI
jgi:tRNA threonylcarbamoyladenosine biosynthesis protein TsaB